MIEDLGGAVLDLAEPITVTRYYAPSVMDGLVQGAPVEEEFVSMMSVQPMPTKELMLLPEGMRASGVVQIFTTDELHTVEQSSGGVPDTFEHNGSDWQIAKVDDWRSSFGYLRAVATRLAR